MTVCVGSFENYFYKVIYQYGVPVKKSDQSKSLGNKIMGKMYHSPYGRGVFTWVSKMINESSCLNIIEYVEET